jgi:hypothetical protein
MPKEIIRIDEESEVPGTGNVELLKPIILKPLLQ